jgi:spermidine synthase
LDGSWIYEKHTESYGVSWKITDILYQEKSEFQEITVVNSEKWGRMLLLDGVVQTTENDEFMYHEMITQVAMHSHPDVKKVLVIGGGDGGTINQIAKHPGVEQIDLVEIDGKVIDTCQKYFPCFQDGFFDSRTNIIIQDGIDFVKNTKSKYDLVIVDSSDPTGPAIGLFTTAFYHCVYQALQNDGMMVTQSESPLFYDDIFTSIYHNISSVFGNAYIYWGTVPTYISGPWTFTIGSKKYNPRNYLNNKTALKLKYYSQAVHQAAFVLPEFIKKQLKESRP